jgi:hypothetical protein
MEGGGESSKNLIDPSEMVIPEIKKSSNKKSKKFPSISDGKTSEQSDKFMKIGESTSGGEEVYNEYDMLNQDKK